jgi:hypothetical protein
MDIQPAYVQKTDILCRLYKLRSQRSDKGEVSSLHLNHNCQLLSLVMGLASHTQATFTFQIALVPIIEAGLT